MLKKNIVPSEDLKSVGLKVTTSRVCILNLFLRASKQDIRHLSADDVYKELRKENKEIGLATIYRVLTQLEQSGILIRHHLGQEQATYELDDGDHHDHLICVRCGKVEEFFDEEIEHRQRLIAEKHGFLFETHTLTLFGICSQCQKELSQS